MISITDKSDCCGCSACLVKCPNECITLSPDKEGFDYPKIDEKKCNNCGLCISVCPIIYSKQKESLDNNKTINEDEKSNKKLYACKNKNEEIRGKSSSGGIFSLIADEVLNSNGIIFGARWNEEFVVEHKDACDEKGLNEFRGSKYVQSKMNDNFKKVETYLKQGKTVLFSGVPCQIAGLKRYLAKDYENLITIDLVCHGVSSPKVLKKYLNFEKNRAKANIKNVYFRDKRTGWKVFSLTIKFDNGKEISQTLFKNVYMRGFLRELYQRPACHECKFRIENYESDITLADYWGIQMFHEELYDNKGTSIAIINSKKGQKIFEKLSNKMEVLETKLEYATVKNRGIIQSHIPNKNRSQFFKYLDCYPIDSLIWLSLRKKEFSIKDHLFLLKEKLKRKL